MTKQSVTPEPLAPRILYSRIEAARQLSISARSLDYLIKGRKIVTRRIGARILIAHDELVRFASSADLRAVTA